MDRSRLIQRVAKVSLVVLLDLREAMGVIKLEHTIVVHAVSALQSIGKDNVS